jgi:hypothetical protein
MLRLEIAKKSLILNESIEYKFIPDQAAYPPYL